MKLHSNNIIKTTDLGIQTGIQTNVNKTPSQFVLSLLRCTMRVAVVGLGLMHGISQAATITVKPPPVVHDPTIKIKGCSLHEAMTAINQGKLSAASGRCSATGKTFGTDDAIIISAGSFPNNTINFQKNDPIIITPNKHVTVQGNNVTLDGNGQSRIFSLALGSSLRLNKVDIKRGNSTAGGAIFLSKAKLLLVDSTMSDNSAKDGGAIYARDNSTVNLIGSTVSQNSADERGGGIYVKNNSTVNLTNDSIVSDNSAKNGGAIYALDNSTVASHFSTMSRNSASATGGGIYVKDNSTVNLTISSTVSDNSASTNGGGIFAEKRSIVNLNGSSVSENSSFLGGGIYVINSTVNLTNNSFMYKNSSLQGGGIYVIGGSVNLSSSTMSANKAKSGSSIYANGTDSKVTLKNITLRTIEGEGKEGVHDCHITNNAIITTDSISSHDGSCASNNDTDDLFVIPLKNGRTVVVPL